MKKKHWMGKAFSKHKGSLHRELDVPEGKTIPASKLAAAKAGKYGKKVAKKANPVVTAKKINSKRKRKRSYKRG
ncbi:MAG TPA: hypothetical protein VJY15_19930 [Candidatus Acidoferrum sp.]|nr:hypothetical protein [Candidatus Acidoferrum sp.]